MCVALDFMWKNGKCMVRFPFSEFSVQIAQVIGYALEQNHPNPFNPTTRIGFSVDGDAHVRLSIYDVSGRLVRTLVDQRLSAGSYAEEWDARDARGNTLGTGVYFYYLKAGNRVLTRKAILLK